MEQLKLKASRKQITVGALIFEGYELLDLYGPLELFGTCNTVTKNRVRVLTISAEESSEGPITLADHWIHDTALPKLDMILIPGGFGTRKLIADASYQEKLRAIVDQVDVVMTVCTGSMLLAETGCLDNRIATTNKAAFHMICEKYPKIKWQSTARWCEDGGKFFTSSGVSAGTDLANHVIERIFDAETAKESCKLAEYVPCTDPLNDPFAAEFQDKTYPSVLPKDMINQQGRMLNLAFILYDNFEMLDTFGPLECFGMANKIFRRQQDAGIDTPLAFNVVVIAEHKIVKSNKGPSFEVDMTFEEFSKGTAKPSFDMLFLPGGIGTLREIHNPIMKKFLSKVVPAAEKFMTVCSGSTILGAHGFLDGKRATSNKLAFNLLALHATKTEWVKNARWIVDGKYYTSSGVAAGTDLALFLLEELFGRPLTLEVAKLAEYNWNEDSKNDPFASTIPKSSLSQKISDVAQKSLLKAVFRVGFALTRNDMRFVTRMISE